MEKNVRKRIFNAHVFIYRDCLEKNTQNVVTLIEQELN